MPPLMPPDEAEQILQQRIGLREHGWLDIRSNLWHFALINFAVPIDRLRTTLPEDRFEIVPFQIGGQTCGLISAVPFLDADFHYQKFPWLKWRFGQTNHRMYVIDRATGQHAAWFFGTTLGSRLVYGARWLWRIPWHWAGYELNCEYDAAARRYRRFEYQVQSDWCALDVALEDSGEPAGLLEGFSSESEQALVLTHPVRGFFHRLDRRLGSYSIWHPRMQLTRGRALRCYVSLYERLGLLTRDEMTRPHSVLIMPEVLFDVRMPPRAIS